jgi:hypothetical protein
VTIERTVSVVYTPTKSPQRPSDFILIPVCLLWCAAIWAAVVYLVSLLIP